MSLSHWLIPDPFDTDKTAGRFAHRDVTELSPGQIWAELVTLERELARRITARERPAIVLAWPAIVDDQAWLLDRHRALRSEQRRRRGVRRHA